MSARLLTTFLVASAVACGGDKPDTGPDDGAELGLARTLVARVVARELRRRRRRQGPLGVLDVRRTV